LQCESGLADAADPDQRHDPGLTERVAHGLKLAVATHEARQDDRQLAPRAVLKRAQGRELARQSRMADLEHILGATDIA
jgi:hypothetical protein